MQKQLDIANTKVSFLKEIITEKRSAESNRILGTHVFDHNNDREIYISFGEDKDIIVNGKKWAEISETVLDEEHY